MAGAKPIPDGYRSLTPYLIVDGASRAIEFYKAVFGATERMRLGAPGGRVGHAELEIGDSLIMLADEHPEIGARGPGAYGGSPVGLHVYVADADAVARKAAAAGAKLVSPLEDKFYGDRSGTIEDPFGHRWYVSTHIEDVPPDEIDRRVAAMAKGRAHHDPARTRTYSAIVDRPPLKLPDGARLVVWTIVNLEFWDISRPMARQVLPAPTGQVLLPDVPNWALARIRDAGRRVALLRAVRAARHPPDPVDQRAGLRGLRARRRRGARGRLGVHGPRLGADADPPGRGPGGDDRPIARRARAIHRHAAGRLARSRADRDLRDARAVGRRRRQIHRRLGL